MIDLRTQLVMRLDGRCLLTLNELQLPGSDSRSAVDLRIEVFLCEMVALMHLEAASKVCAERELC